MRSALVADDERRAAPLASQRLHVAQSQPAEPTQLVAVDCKLQEQEVSAAGRGGRRCRRKQLKLHAIHLRMMIPSVELAPTSATIGAGTRQNPPEQDDKLVIYGSKPSQTTNALLIQIVENEGDANADNDHADDVGRRDQDEEPAEQHDDPLARPLDLAVPRSARYSPTIGDADELAGWAPPPRLVEKSVIIHKDEHGFGLRFKGQKPVFVEHVHENGAAWRAGVRQFDAVNKVNGIPVGQLSHKDVVLMFKACSRFVALTLLSCARCGPPRGLQPQYVMRAAGRQAAQRDQADQADHADQDPTGQQQQLARRSSCTLEGRNQRQASTYSHRGAFVKSSSGDLIGGGGGVSLGRGFASPGAGQLNSSLLLTTDSITACGSGSQADPAANQAQAVAVETSATGCSKLGRRASNDSIENEKLARDKRLAVDGAGGASSSNSQNYTPGPSEQLGQPAASRPESALAPPLAVSSDDRKRLLFKLSQSSSTNSLPTDTKLKTAGAQGAPTAAAAAAAAANVKPATVAPAPPVNKRLEIIREFIDTERTHTERLRCLDELFYRPLKAGNLMTRDQLRAVFSCHRTLYRIHRQIYRTLLSADCFKLCSEPLVGSALLEIFEGPLKRRLERAACSFCTAQATNVELLNKLTRRDTKTGELLAHVASQQMVGRLGIKDLLASCFQRLTKYPLLLEGLLRATPSGPASPDDEPRKQAGEPPGVELVDAGDAEAAAQSLKSRRMLAISLAEEREFVERALRESREILVRVNETIRVATSRQKLKDIWRRTDRHPAVPAIDIAKQQVVHEGALTLRLSRRSFDVYVLLLNDYLVILTREGQDKFRLKFFSAPDAKSSSAGGGGGASSSGAPNAPGSSNSGHHQQQQHQQQQPGGYSPVFVIDEHLATRDAATDENGFYLLCKRKDDSRIYEFAARSPAERLKWRDKIQLAIEHRLSGRRASCESALTKSSSGVSGQTTASDQLDAPFPPANGADRKRDNDERDIAAAAAAADAAAEAADAVPQEPSTPTKFVGTISYVDRDEIVLPSEMATFSANVKRAIQLNIAS